jgi:hypothetical protein
VSNRLDPIFRRSEVAKILGITKLTMANREKDGRYPPARRDLNGYRVYNVHEVMNLQLLTYDMIDPRPIASLLWDKGWVDPKEVSQLIDRAMARRVKS